MTHGTRFVAVAVLVALVLCVPVQAQTPEIDALRARAEVGDAAAHWRAPHCTPCPPAGGSASTLCP
jgi:DMSO/TMAO reductase YedYZ heme-binding membrane subunit